MRRETHVRFYESLGVKLPGATHPGLGLLGTSQSSQPTVGILPEIKLQDAHFWPRTMVGVVEGFGHCGCHRLFRPIPLVFCTHRILLIRAFVRTLATAWMDRALAMGPWLLPNLFGKGKNASTA
jgi:hypothetical protein